MNHYETILYSSLVTNKDTGNTLKVTPDDKLLFTYMMDCCLEQGKPLTESWTSITLKVLGRNYENSGTLKARIKELCDFGLITADKTPSGRLKQNGKKFIPDINKLLESFEFTNPQLKTHIKEH